MKFYIITPCTRVHNLPFLYESIQLFRSNVSFHVEWVVVLDMPWPEERYDFDGCHYMMLNTEGKGTVGHDQRNFMLDSIAEGYIYFLDDDNILHPAFHRIEKHLNEGVIVVNQVWKDGATRLTAAPENVRVGGIDTAQFIFNRKVAGARRFPLVYEGDGLFISEVYKNNTTRFNFVKENLSYYNYLR